VIRPFVKPEMMQWKDDARWYDDRFSCDWRLELGFFTEQVDIRGATRFEALGADRCKVVIDGELKVDANNLPGVPRLLAGKIVGEVEKFVVKMITPQPHQRQPRPGALPRRAQGLSAQSQLAPSSMRPSQSSSTRLQTSMAPA
jgi:hypothetical protein